MRPVRRRSLAPVAAPMVGEWVFRHAGGCLIDTPDVAPMTANQWRWLSTLTLVGGVWTRFDWYTGERGWMIPHTLMVGDILEFGSSVYDRHRRPIMKLTACWYGWLHHATDRALIVHGPYPAPGDALVAARPNIDEIRLAQLDPLVAWPSGGDHG